MNGQVLDRKPGLIKRFLKKADVLFVCCTHRYMDIDAMTTVMNLYAQRKHNFTWLPMKGDALIDRSRSRVASYFMRERKEDIIFFVDDDEKFSPEDVIKVVDNIMNGMDICGGLVMLKKPVDMIRNYIDKNVLFFDGQEVIFSKDAKPVEIMYLGSGFMAVHRKVFQKMIDDKVVPYCHPNDLKFWPFFQPYPKEIRPGYHVYLSEDWAMNDRARQLGFKVWLDPSIFIEHKGEYSWNLADTLRSKKVPMDDKFSITIS